MRTLRAVVVVLALTAPACGGGPTGEAGVASAADPAGSVHRAPDADAWQSALEQPLPDANRALSRWAAAVEEDLRRLYAAGDAVWFAAGSARSSRVRAALDTLAGAAAHGLPVAAYGLDAIRRQAEAALTDSSSAASHAAADVALSRALLTYWHDVHRGRVDPRAVGVDLDVPGDDTDYVARLREAVADDRLAGVTEDLAPSPPQYGRLREALARYRRLAGELVSFELPLPTHTRSVKPGDPLPQAEDLARRLAALGDLPGGVEVRRPVYDGALVDAVARFQRRHGLEPDSALGPATLAALRTPLGARVRQIELALERLRWLPGREPESLLVVNIPMFEVWAFDDARSASRPALTMRVVVGRARATETPEFGASLDEVVFRPYWNVPPSILRGEILPALAKDPGYLRRENMEIVAGAGDDASLVAASDDALARLRRGELRVRQRPGPQNALGLVKFVFPNANDVYMHGTPATSLFALARRDFSHGCVRVEHPAELAAWVLRREGDWTMARIREAMAGNRPALVPVEPPIRVVLLYLTAAAPDSDGTVRFAEDVYGRDDRLAEALGLTATTSA